MAGNIILELVEHYGGRAALAARVNVSSKTIERWIKAKRVSDPKYALLLRDNDEDRKWVKGKFTIAALIGKNGRPKKMARTG